MGFLDSAADSGLLGGIASFGQGFLQGQERAEDRKMKQLEHDAKYKANEIDLQKKDRQKSFDQAGKLRDDWLKNQTTKNSQSVKEAYDKIRSAPQTAAGDMSLIYGFMRMQDPGSTVREGEFATAQNAAGIPDQIRNMYNRAMSGQRLNPNQRNDFMNSAGRIYSAQQKSQGAFDEQFGGLADTYGIPREEVVLKIFTDPQTGEQKAIPVPAQKAQPPGGLMAPKKQGLVSPGAPKKKVLSGKEIEW